MISKINILDRWVRANSYWLLWPSTVREALRSLKVAWSYVFPASSTDTKRNLLVLFGLCLP